jgi:hypothetical protein
MKKARDVHRLLEKVNLKVNADADREVLEGILRASRKSTLPVSQRDVREIISGAKLWRFTFWRKASYLAVALLVVSSLVACFILSGKVSELKDELEQSRRDVALAQQNNASAQTDDAATINFYLKEHQEVVAQHASINQDTAQPVQMHVNKHEILYYESFDDGPEYMSPGIIVRGGPSSQLQTGSTKASTIANGHTLSLSEARKTAGFKLVSPSWFRPCYRLDQIRKIEGRDALQLIYANGINSLSLFEQPLDGKYRLSRQDFREYAVYRNKGQTGGTILTWRDDSLSYVLIGNAELSTLMDIAQSINAIK